MAELLSNAYVVQRSNKKVKVSMSTLFVTLCMKQQLTSVHDLVFLSQVGEPFDNLERQMLHVSTVHRGHFVLEKKRIITKCMCIR